MEQLSNLIGQLEETLKRFEFQENLIKEEKLKSEKLEKERRKEELNIKKIEIEESKKEDLKHKEIKKQEEENLELFEKAMEDKLQKTSKQKEELKQLIETFKTTENEFYLKTKKYNDIPGEISEEKINNNNSLSSGNEKEVNISKNILSEEKKLFKLNICDYNYLKLNFTNKENKEINSVLINFIKVFKMKIKEKFDKLEIKVNFDDEKNNTFKICYEISPMNFDKDEIEFLDEEFEKKVNNIQKFEIKVELIEGDKNLHSINNVHQYYLIFIGVSVEKEDFYVHLQILKDIVKNLILN